MSRKVKIAVALAGSAAAALAVAAPASATINDVLQEVPTPASGSCADYASPAAFNWAGVGSNSWASTFGGKCVRTVMFDNSRQIYFVR